MSQYTDPGLVLEPGEPDEPLRDEALRKALAQAPDRATLPDWRVRQAIREHAHDAVSASDELLTASREHAPWWRLAWWRDKVGLSGATPWNAALASLMVAVLVTLLWQREPLPGPRPDDEAASREATAPATLPAPAPTAKDEVASRSEAPTPRAEAPSPAPAAPAAPQEEKKPSAPPVLAQAPNASQAPPVPQVPEAARPEQEAVGTVRPRTDSFAAPPASLSSIPAPARTAIAPPVAQPAPAPLAPPAPSVNRSSASGSARQAAPSAAAPAASSEPPPMPDFSSLSRWTELRVANVSGEVRMVPRAEAGELGLLMSSAAIMAVGAPPLRSLPEWRVSLERRGQVLAVLEVARNDVRWTEGALPPSTGQPSSESLEALRRALGQAIKSGGPARAVQAVPPVKAPDSRSSGRLPYSPLAPPALPSAEVPAPVAPQRNGSQSSDLPREPE